MILGRTRWYLPGVYPSLGSAEWLVITTAILRPHDPLISDSMSGVPSLVDNQPAVVQPLLSVHFGT
jgi:hypothetical protein